MVGTFLWSLSCPGRSVTQQNTYINSAIGVNTNHSDHGRGSVATSVFEQVGKTRLFRMYTAVALKRNLKGPYPTCVFVFPIGPLMFRGVMYMIL